MNQEQELHDWLIASGMHESTPEEIERYGKFCECPPFDQEECRSVGLPVEEKIEPEEQTNERE